MTPKAPKKEKIIPWHNDFAKWYKGRNQSTPSQYIMPGQDSCCQQHILVSFLDEHREDVRKLKRQLKNFRRDIQIELASSFSVETIVGIL